MVKCPRCRDVGVVVYEKDGFKTIAVCPYCEGFKKKKLGEPLAAEF